MIKSIGFFIAHSILALIFATSFSYAQKSDLELKSFTSSFIKDAISQARPFSRKSSYNIGKCSEKKFQVSDIDKIFKIIGIGLSEENKIEFNNLVDAFKDKKCITSLNQEASAFSDFFDSELRSNPLSFAFDSKKIIEMKDYVNSIYFCSLGDEKVFSDLDDIKSQNTGIVNYFLLNLFKKVNYLLPLLETIKVVKAIEQKAVTYFDFPASASMFDSSDDLNVYSIAQRKCKGDPRCSIYVLSFFGHDNTANMTNPSLQNQVGDKILSWLLQHTPSITSKYYSPGALNGVNFSRNGSMLNKMRSLEEKMNLVFKKFPSLFNDPDELYEVSSPYKLRKFFRAGYYHVFGGALMGALLVEQGYGIISGIEFSTLFPKILAKAYKIRSTEHLITQNIYTESYWTQSKERPKKVPSFKDIEGNESLEIAKKQLAVLFTELNYFFIEYTGKQHELGAKFSVQQYKKFIKNNCSIE